MMSRDLAVMLIVATTLFVALVWLYYRFYKAIHHPPELKWPEKISGFAYVPYRPGHTPEGQHPSQDEVLEDLKLLSQLTDNIRTYSVGGIQQHIPALAASLGIKVTLGIWIDADETRSLREIEQAIEIANASANVVAILVGNEALFRHDVSLEQLIAYIDRVRSAVKVPVSVSEQWHVWVDHPALVDHVDMVAAHILPYWESVSFERGVQSVLDNIEQLETLFPGKPILLGEVGWPSQGAHPGNGTITNQGHQAIYVRTLVHRLNRLGRNYFVMEAFDQPWKLDEGEAGPHWGIFDAHRQPKFSFEGEIVVLLDLQILLFRLIDGANLTTRGWTALAIAAFGSAAGLFLVGHGYAQHYNSWIGLLLSLIWVTTLFLAIITETHELAEAAWTPERRRMFLPWQAPSKRFPKVSIHVPCYNEPPEMVIRTLNYLARLDYPNFEVLVIDNNTIDPDVWKPLREHCETLGGRFKFFHVAPLDGFKSGALNYLAPHTAADAEIIAVIDSDYCVDINWLRHLVPHFSDPMIAIIQSPQDYRDQDESLFKSFCFSEYRGFFNIGMIVRNDHNAIIQHGTMTMIRRSVMQQLGWADWCICEDAEFGLRVMEKGYSTAYVRRSYGQGLIPDTFTDFKKQRFRWAYGAIQIIKRHADSLLLGKNTQLNFRQRYHFMVGWLPWISEGVNLLWVGFILAWSAAMVVWPSIDPLPALFSALPSLVLIARSGKIIYLYKHLAEADFKDATRAVLAGTALYYTIAKAVLYGFFTNHIPFRRTPKHASQHGLLLAISEVREELSIMLLLWGAALGILLQHGLSTIDLYFWIAMLLVQSMPYQASMLMALLSAQPRPLKVHSQEVDQQPVNQ